MADNEVNDEVNDEVDSEVDSEANREQRENWNGASGEAWARTQEEHDVILEAWARVLAETAAIGGGERVLDVGCGCGATTLEAAASCGPAGTAVGVDLSEPMLDVARRRATAGGVTNVRFVTGDAQVDDLVAVGGGTPYDVVISRFGVMFFDDPVAAFANLAAATRPGGRLAMVVWTPMPEQEWLTVPAAAAMEHLGAPELAAPGAPGMFALAEPERVAEILQAAGWTDVAADRQQRRFPIGGHGGLDDAVAFLQSSGPGRALFAEADPDAAKRAVEAIREALEPHVTPTGVELDGAVWAVTARR